MERRFMDLAHDPHVLTIGEALIDLAFPAGHPERAVGHPGGSPANVAMTLGRLGRPVVFQTWYGDDDYGRQVEEYYRASNVFITPESKGADHTTTAMAELNEKGAATYTFDFVWDPSAPMAISDQAEIIEAGSISAAQQPGAGVVLEALKAARDHAVIAFDPNVRPAIMGTPEKALPLVEEFVAVTDLVKVSDEDLEWLTGSDDIDAVVARWLDLGPSMIIVTRGKKGGLAVTKSGLRVEHAPKKVKVIDTIGAGDSFMGGILDALWGLGIRGAAGKEALKSIDEDSVKKILARASAVSDVTVSRAGANPPWADELED